MIEGLVSAVVPVFNRAAMLREAVASVLAQTWRPIEIIIVDDGSTDDTDKVAAELAAQRPDEITVLTQLNAGPGAARQAGFERTRGEFVQFLDSDDLLLPHKFEVQVAGLREDTEAGISYGKTYVRERGTRLPEPAQSSGVRRRRLFPDLLTTRIWDTSTPLYRRTALEQIGPWSRRWQLEDWEFDARAGAAGIQLQYCDSWVSESRNHDGDRLCHSWMRDERAMRDRIAAYVDVLGHAKRAGVEPDAPELQRFVRSLFWMARNAGRHGLPAEAQRLFDLARAHAARPGWDYRMFAAASAVLGWRHASRLAEMLQSLATKGRGDPAGLDPRGLGSPGIGEGAP